MATIEDVLNGTLRRGDNNLSFQHPPVLPANLFVVCAQLLEQSGAYHHVAPASRPGESSPRRLIVDDKLRRRAIRAAKRWCDAPEKPPARVEKLWRELVKSREVPVFQPGETDLPPWWSHTLELLMIADEASAGLGFDPNNNFAQPFSRAMKELSRKLSKDERAPQAVERGLISYATIDNAIACVQAKSRTPGLGCTLRSLTHHLALLPPRGSVRARWVGPNQAKSKTTVADLAKPLNLLLVPFPYRVDPNAFRDLGGPSNARWRWFGVEPTWAPASQSKRSAFIEFVRDLLNAAKARVTHVHGLIFPELALDWRLFAELGDFLSKTGEVDFLITGLAQDRNRKRGNFVGIVPYFLIPQKSMHRGLWQDYALVREKHHRWKLTDTQIKDYQLENQLSPEFHWWEKIDLTSRSMDIFVYRGHTTLTTLICEDLARIDPCQTVLRAIGPNLVITLLMDGPQLPERWAARYATVLAEDPGSSVLSFTSWGLIARQNDFGTYGQQSSIALWKDQQSRTKKIELSRDAWAVCLSLENTPLTEFTLDGRSDEGASHIWTLRRNPIMVAPRRQIPVWIERGDGAS